MKQNVYIDFGNLIQSYEKKDLTKAFELLNKLEISTKNNDTKVNLTEESYVFTWYCYLLYLASNNSDEALKYETSSEILKKQFKRKNKS